MNSHCRYKQVWLEQIPPRTCQTTLRWAHLRISYDQAWQPRSLHPYLKNNARFGWHQHWKIHATIKAYRCYRMQWLAPQNQVKLPRARWHQRPLMSLVWIFCSSQEPVRQRHSRGKPHLVRCPQQRGTLSPERKAPFCGQACLRVAQTVLGTLSLDKTTHRNW